MNASKRRAIGITRVSVEGARQADRLYSHATQAEAIEASCRREGIELLYVGRGRAGADHNAQRLSQERDARQEALDQLPPTAGLDMIVRVDDDLPLPVRRDLVRLS